MNDMLAKIKELNEQNDRVNALFNTIIYWAIKTPESINLQTEMDRWPRAHHIAFDPPWKEAGTKPILHNLAEVLEHQGITPDQIVGFGRGMIDGAYVFAVGHKT